MSVMSSARLSSGIKAPRPCLEGTRHRHSRHGRTPPIVRSMSKLQCGESDVDVVMKNHDGRVTPESATAAPCTRRELMTAAVSLTANVTAASSVSAAFAAEPTLVGDPKLATCVESAEEDNSRPSYLHLTSTGVGPSSRVTALPLCKSTTTLRLSLPPVPPTLSRFIRDGTIR